MQYAINTKGVNRDPSAFQALSRIIVYVSEYITLRTPCLGMWMHFDDGEDYTATAC